MEERPGRRGVVPSGGIVLDICVVAGRREPKDGRRVILLEGKILNEALRFHLQPEDWILYFRRSFIHWYAAMT